jgi:hypothetical protein
MSDGNEFRLKIEAYTPETMPMERLAGYLAEFARMLGESASVHFVRLEPGSTSIVHRIDTEAIPKVKNRTSAVRRGLGPRDSVRAYRRINKMLIEDNGSAVWREEKTEADIIVFPGKAAAEELITGITQTGSIDGEVVRVGGLQSLVPIMLRSENQELSGCWADRTVAKALAGHLFEPVRLFGTGRWNRNDEGTWKLDFFRVASFGALREVSLSGALNELRTIPMEWDEHAFEELTSMRGAQLVVFDATMLMLLIRPESARPKNPDTGASLEYVQERIAYFVQRHEKAKTRIGIPTPALSEVLVRSGSAAVQIVTKIKELAIFEILPFDELSAIEVALMTRVAIESGDKKAGSDETWNKIKYDRRRWIEKHRPQNQHTGVRPDGFAITAGKAQGELRLASPTDQPDEPALDEPALDEVEEARDAEPAAAFIEKNEDTP